MSGAPIRVALLGSTGSIGRQTLDVLLSAGPEAFRVVAMAAGRDVATFSAQVAQVRPQVVTLADTVALAVMTLPAGTTADADPDAMLTFATREDDERFPFEFRPGQGTALREGVFTGDDNSEWRLAKDDGF